MQGRLFSLGNRLLLLFSTRSRVKQRVHEHPALRGAAEAHVQIEKIYPALLRLLRQEAVL